MHRIFWALLLLAAIPSHLFASGSVPTTRGPSRDSFSRYNAHTQAQSQSKNNSQSNAVVEDETYNVGKALFSGKYKLGNPALTSANVAEKKLRLTSLRNALPAAERRKMNPAELSQRLSDREMDALEYYLGVRFGKVITKAPSWAKKESRSKVASAD